MIIPGRSIVCFVFAILVFLFVWLSPRSKTLSKNHSDSSRRTVKFKLIPAGIVLLFMGVWEILYPLE
ncbi:hypothetical protein DFP98_14826 [Cohnella phaseoli]|uniref:Uncharacterized protein n=1 Tax=Cohnella phaseoli TaxID=456490 RepID=A0A3D9HYQ0_9BACL|nr:hypothetical protein DFP98_14826 [Cohnella phaseoli]